MHYRKKRARKKEREKEKPLSTSKNRHFTSTLPYGSRDRRGDEVETL